MASESAEQQVEFTPPPSPSPVIAEEELRDGPSSPQESEGPLLEEEELSPSLQEEEPLDAAAEAFISSSNISIEAKKSTTEESTTKLTELESLEQRILLIDWDLLPSVQNPEKMFLCELLDNALHEQGTEALISGYLYEEIVRISTSAGISSTSAGSFVSGEQQDKTHGENINHGSSVVAKSLFDQLSRKSRFEKYICASLELACFDNFCKQKFGGQGWVELEGIFPHCLNVDEKGRENFRKLISHQFTHHIIDSLIMILISS